MVNNKSANFIRSHLRKSRGQIVCILLLFVIAAALINTFFFLEFDYKDNFYREKERLNGEDIDFLFIAPAHAEPLQTHLKDTLEAEDEVRASEITPTLFSLGSTLFKGESLGCNMVFMRVSDAKNKSIGRFDFLSDSGEEGVYLSYHYEVEGGYAVGDTIPFTLGDTDYSFKVVGFYHNVDTGTTNCTDVSFLLTDGAFDTLTSGVSPAYRVSILVEDPAERAALESSLGDSLGRANPALLLLESSHFERLVESRYIIATIFEAIISVAAVLMVVVVLTVISITLNNNIRNSIRDLGTLKALGYSSANLIRPFVAEFSLIAVVSSAVGTGLSYAFLPLLNDVLERQVGVPYTVHFLPLPALLSVGVSLLTAAAVTYLSVRKIRRVMPIEAIRSGGKNKGARDRLVALDKTKLNVNNAIAVKSWLGEIGRNIILLVSLFGVAFLMGFSVNVYQNIVMDSTDIINLVCGQTTDSSVSVFPEDEEALRAVLDTDPAVERYYLFSTVSLCPEGKGKFYTYVIDDPAAMEDYILLDGRFPVNGDEITVNATFASSFDIAIGDTLSIEGNVGSADFTVVGLCQGAYYTGRDAYALREGFERLDGFSYVTYHVDLKEGVDTDAFNKSVAGKTKILFSQNYRQTVMSLSDSYGRVLNIASVLVMALSLVITSFLLYILVSLLLANKQREHGILKSLGYVTKNIVWQTVLSLLPPCLLGTVAGLAVARNGAGTLLILAVKSIGIYSFGKPAAVYLLVIAGAVLLLFSLAYTVVLSSSVRKITPHELFNRE